MIRLKRVPGRYPINNIDELDSIFRKACYFRGGIYTTRKNVPPRPLSVLASIIKYKYIVDMNVVVILIARYQIFDFTVIFDHIMNNSFE